MTDSPDVSLELFDDAADLGRDDAVFDMLLDGLSGHELVLQYQCADAFVSMLDARRKTQNQRLLDFGKAWKARKTSLAQAILGMLEAHGVRGKPGSPDQDKRKISTLLGTTYRVARKEWTASIKQGSKHENAAIVEMFGGTVPKSSTLTETVEEWGVREGLLELVPKLTEKGRAYVESELIGRCASTGEIPDYANVRAPGWTIATRLKGGPERAELVQDGLTAALLRSRPPRDDPALDDTADPLTDEPPSTGEGEI